MLYSQYFTLTFVTSVYSIPSARDGSDWQNCQMKYTLNNAAIRNLAGERGSSIHCTLILTQKRWNQNTEERETSHLFKETLNSQYVCVSVTDPSTVSTMMNYLNMMPSKDPANNSDQHISFQEMETHAVSNTIFDTLVPWLNWRQCHLVGQWVGYSWYRLIVLSLYLITVYLLFTCSSLVPWWYDVSIDESRNFG